MVKSKVNEPKIRHLKLKFAHYVIAFYPRLSVFLQVPHFISLPGTITTEIHLGHARPEFFM